MNEKRNYVAVLPDGREHFEDVTFYRHTRPDDELQRVAENAVRKAGITTPRKDPERITVKVFALEIKQGKLDRRLAKEAIVAPPMERMTQAEFDEELTEILSDLPEAFHPFIRQESWEHGHSAGLEEVILYARSMAHDLKPCIETYRKSLTPAGVK